MEIAVKQRNNSVDFWRLFLTFAIAMGHYTRIGIGFRGVDLTGVFTIFNGGYIVYFLLITGYFMMAGIQKQKVLGIVEQIGPEQASWNYLKSRFRALWPAFFVGNLFGFIVNVVTNPEITSAKDIFVYFTSKIYVFMGIETSGMTGSVSSLGGATWYISAIFVTALPLFYLICKHEKAFKGWVGPMIVLIVWGYYGIADMGMMGAFARNTLVFGLFENSWVLGFASFCLGALLWYPVEKLKTASLSSFQKGCINIVAILLTVLFLWISIINESLLPREDVALFFMAVFVIIILSGRDCVSKVLNKASFFGKTGKFSLYMFTIHMPYAQRVFPDIFTVTADNYYLALVLYAASLVVITFIVMFITEKLIRPLLRAIIGSNKAKLAEA